MLWATMLIFWLPIYFWTWRMCAKFQHGRRNLGLTFYLVKFWVNKCKQKIAKKLLLRSCRNFAQLKGNGEIYCQPKFQHCSSRYGRNIHTHKFNAKNSVVWGGAVRGLATTYFFNKRKIFETPVGQLSIYFSINLLA